MKYPKRCQYKHAKQKKYHVRNWAEYNEGLRRRGDLTVWFDEEAIANWKADKTGKPGGQRVYSDMAIETGLVVRMVYKLAYRQTEGFLHSIRLLDTDVRNGKHVRSQQVKYQEHLGRFAVWAYRLWPDSTTTHRRLPTSERGSRTRGGCRMI